MNVGAVPCLLALGGLGVWLVSSGFAAWASVVGWLITLALGGRRQPLPMPSDRAPPIALAILWLPILAFTGGWWVVPADLGWLALWLLEPVVRPEQRRA